MSVFACFRFFFYHAIGALRFIFAAVCLSPFRMQYGLHAIHTLHLIAQNDVFRVPLGSSTDITFAERAGWRGYFAPLYYRLFHDVPFEDSILDPTWPSQAPMVQSPQLPPRHQTLEIRVSVGTRTLVMRGSVLTTASDIHSFVCSEVRIPTGSLRFTCAGKPLCGSSTVILPEGAEYCAVQSSFVCRGGASKRAKLSSEADFQSDADTDEANSMEEADVASSADEDGHSLLAGDVQDVASLADEESAGHLSCDEESVDHLSTDSEEEIALSSADEDDLSLLEDDVHDVAEEDIAQSSADEDDVHDVASLADEGSVGGDHYVESDEDRDVMEVEDSVDHLSADSEEEINPAKIPLSGSFAADAHAVELRDQREDFGAQASLLSDASTLRALRGAHVDSDLMGIAATLQREPNSLIDAQTELADGMLGAGIRYETQELQARAIAQDEALGGNLHKEAMVAKLQEELTKTKVALQMATLQNTCMSKVLQDKVEELKDAIIFAEELNLRIDSMQRDADSEPEVCRLLKEGIQRGYFKGKEVLYNYVFDVARASQSPGGRVQYSQTTWDLSILLYNIGHGSLVDSLHHNLLAPSLSAVETKARAGAAGMYLPRDLDRRTFECAVAWYAKQGIDLKKERCVIVFDATAVLPYITVAPDGKIGGLRNWEKYSGDGDVQSKLKAIFDGKEETAKQVMAFVLVPTSILNAPPYVLAACEHFSCNSDDVVKWDKQATRLARVAGIEHYCGLIADGDAGPRKFSKAVYSAVTVPAEYAIGMQRGHAFTTFFGVYDREGGKGESCIIFRSDPTHLLKKGRNQLLNMPTRTLVIGDYHVSLEHLHEYYCIAKEPGFTGGPRLAKCTINVSDKQNAKAAECLVGDPDLPAALLAAVGKKAAGTAAYLRIYSQLNKALRASDLAIEDRLTAALEAQYTIDYWALWVEERPEYSKAANFISNQLHYDTGITIAALLVDYASAALDSPDKMFFPAAYSSDPIENLFGQIRMLVPGKTDVDFVTFVESAKRIGHDWSLRYKKDAHGKLIYYSRSTDNRKHSQKQLPVILTTASGHGALVASIIELVNKCAGNAESIAYQTLADLGADITAEKRDRKSKFHINHPTKSQSPPVARVLAAAEDEGESSDAESIEGRGALRGREDDEDESGGEDNDEAHNEERAGMCAIFLFIRLC